MDYIVIIAKPDYIDSKNRKVNPMNRFRMAFTLIELLVVVAIIAILVLIAVPNFIGALTKSRVARSQADIKSIGTAMMMYRADTNQIPPLLLSTEGSQVILRPQHITKLFYLTTPIAYISAGSMRSPFSYEHGYWYYNWEWFKLESGSPRMFYWNNRNNGEPATWMIDTIGPNGIQFPYEVLENNLLMFHDYNPTNGVVSAGIIQTHGI